MAVVRWDPSIPQAMAAQVAERELASDQEAERHCRHASEQQQHWHSIARAERANMNSIEKEVLTALLLLPRGSEMLGRCLADPLLCGACLMLQEQLVACGHNCGRQLCQECRSEDNT